MKTTLELDDALDAQLRQAARRRGWSLKETVSRAIREGLRALRSEGRPGRPFRWATSKGRLLIDPCDRDALDEALKPEL